MTRAPMTPQEEAEITEAIKQDFRNRLEPLPLSKTEMKYFAHIVFQARQIETLENQVDSLKSWCENLETWSHNDTKRMDNLQSQIDAMKSKFSDDAGSKQ